jgi:hypothetical protein
MTKNDELDGLRDHTEKDRQATKWQSAENREAVESCNHVEFEAKCEINRIVDTGTFAVDVQVRCAHCRELFRFLGTPPGISYFRPMVSVTGTELRAPIEPEGDPQLFKKMRVEVPK